MMPDGLADVHLVAAAEVAAVAHRADAAAGLAGEHGADENPLDAGRFDSGDLGFVDLLVGLDDAVVRSRVGDVLERDATEDALAERVTTSPPSSSLLTQMPSSVSQS